MLWSLFGGPYTDKIKLNLFFLLVISLYCRRYLSQALRRIEGIHSSSPAQEMAWKRPAPWHTLPYELLHLLAPEL